MGKCTAGHRILTTAVHCLLSIIVCIVWQDKWEYIIKENDQPCVNNTQKRITQAHDPESPFSIPV